MLVGPLIGFLIPCALFNWYYSKEENRRNAPVKPPGSVLALNLNLTTLAASISQPGVTPTRLPCKPVRIRATAPSALCIDYMWRQLTSLSSMCVACCGAPTTFKDAAWMINAGVGEALYVCQQWMPMPYEDKPFEAVPLTCMRTMPVQVPSQMELVARLHHQHRLDAHQPGHVHRLRHLL